MQFIAQTNRTLWGFLALCGLLFVLAGCQNGPLIQDTANNATGATEALDSPLSDISGIQFVPPTPQPELSTIATVITQNSRANIRSGPGLDNPIVGKGNPGESFQVVGRSEDGEWWEICCVQGEGDAAGSATQQAWLANSVVQIEGDTQALASSAPILPDDFEGQWRVDWSCGSERCDIQECTATVDAQALNVASQLWLQVEHQVTWDEACFSTDSWEFDVNRYTGEERSGQYLDNFLYSYWLGAQPGDATNVFAMDDGTQIAVWCSGPQEVEVDEGGGWTTVYEGRTCHDIRTGTLMLLNYTKRWLFTGEFEGESYDRAYFGDFESLEQRLVSTTSDLYIVGE